MSGASRRFPELTEAQEAFLVSMTTQRVANLLETADFVADLSREAKDFLREAEPETLEFLRKARSSEIKELERGIDLVRAMKTAGRFVRWTVIVVFGCWVGFMTVWDRIASFFSFPKH